MTNLTLEKCPCCGSDRVQINPEQLFELLGLMEDRKIGLQVSVNRPLTDPEIRTAVKDTLDGDQVAPETVKPKPQKEKTNKTKKTPPAKQKAKKSKLDPLPTQLKAWMDRCDLTPVPAGKELGVSEGVIRRILAGVPGRPVIDLKVANALGYIDNATDPAKPESKPPPPISVPKTNGIKNPSQAAQFFTDSVNDWIESEGIDPVIAAEMLRVNQKVLANIRLKKGGHLPHPNIIANFSKHIPAIRNQRGILLTARRQLEH